MKCRAGADVVRSMFHQGALLQGGHLVPSREPRYGHTVIDFSRELPLQYTGLTDHSDLLLGVLNIYFCARIQTG